MRLPSPSADGRRQSPIVGEAGSKTPEQDRASPHARPAVSRGFFDPALNMMLREATGSRMVFGNQKGTRAGAYDRVEGRCATCTTGSVQRTRGAPRWLGNALAAEDAIRIAVALVLVLVGGCGKSEAQKAAEQRAAEEDRLQEARAKAKLEEFKRRDEEAARTHALMYPDVAVTEDPSWTDKRTLLSKIAADPKGMKPRATRPPDQDEPFWTYEFDVPGIGAVMDWRTDAERWDITTPSTTSPEMFAPPGGLRSIVSIGPVTWWRVTSGPFNKAFVQRHPGGVSVRSMHDVCSGNTFPEKLADECNRY
jgi:hypothetical protein